MKILQVGTIENYPFKNNRVNKSKNKTTINYSTNLLSANAIYNASFINFKGKNSNSYSEFIKTAHECGINSIEKLQENITSENFLGSGANSNVYRFNDKRLDEWVLKEYKNSSDRNPDLVFEPVEDKFKGKNMGQEIAKVGGKYGVLRKVNGKPHSVEDWSYHISKNTGVTKEEAQSFSKSLKDISEFPQSSFDDSMEQLRLLNQNGYKQDSINPNNLLVDYDKKEIHIIDSYEPGENNPKTNTMYDMTSLLLDFSLYKLFIDKLNDEEKQEMINSSNKIIEKCKIAAEKSGISKDEEEYLNYLGFIDKIFGGYLEDKGGNYTSRYNSMKDVLNS